MTSSNEAEESSEQLELLEDPATNDIEILVEDKLPVKDLNG